MSECYRVWHIPQMPMEPFVVRVSSVDEGIFVIDTLDSYDNFQYEHNVKPDYASASGIERWDPDAAEWEEVDEDDVEHRREEITVARLRREAEPSIAP